MSKPQPELNREVSKDQDAPNHVRAWCGDALWAALRAEGLDTVEGAFAYRDADDMTVPNLGHRQRWRIRLTAGDGRRRELFMKRYEREPLSWRVRRCLTYGPRRSPAGVEFDNIRSLARANVPSIAEAVRGERMDLWGARRSYIIVAAVPGEALEQCAKPLLQRWADQPGKVERFTEQLAGFVGAFHGRGYVHRDLYNCHIFLHERGDEIELRLIDLARVFRPGPRAFRWRVKDLAQLKYSMPADWVAGHWETFLRQYIPTASASAPRRWDRAIGRKVAFIRRHSRRPADDQP